jgi:hypothetical protein
MKKRIVTLIAILSAFFSFEAAANNYTAELVLSVWDNASFYIVVDGQTISNKSNSYHIGLDYGNHRLEVYAYSSYGNLSHCYFNNYISLSPGITTATITRFGDFHKISHKENNNYAHYGNTGRNGHYGNNGNYGYNGYNNNSGYNAPTYGSSGYYNGHNGYYSYSMSNADFNELKRIIRNTSFDNSRLDIAKSAVVDGITSSQVKELCNLFTYESTRLEFAKFAYHYTVDKNRYYIVNDALIYRSSKSELSEYILYNR